MFGGKFGTSFRAISAIDQAIPRKPISSGFADMGTILLYVFLGLLALIFWRKIVKVLIMAAGLALILAIIWVLRWGFSTAPYITGLVLIWLIIFGIKESIKEAQKKEEQEKAKKEEKEKQEKAKKEEEYRQNVRLEEERRKAKEERQRKMDEDVHLYPYTYKIGRHGNESLAIRYGIANQEKRTKEYWYYGPGGERKRNPERDRFYYEPAENITLQKTRRVKDNLYEVLLTDFRDRKARAIIEQGTDYVKTFYPLDDDWFIKHADLEQTLKGSRTFTLKELATFHVNKTVGHC